MPSVSCSDTKFSPCHFSKNFGLAEVLPKHIYWVFLLGKRAKKNLFYNKKGAKKMLGGFRSSCVRAGCQILATPRLICSSNHRYMFVICPFCVPPVTSRQLRNKSRTLNRQADVLARSQPFPGRLELRGCYCIQ